MPFHLFRPGIAANTISPLDFPFFYNKVRAGATDNFLPGPLYFSPNKPCKERSPRPQNEQVRRRTGATKGSDLQQIILPAAPLIRPGRCKERGDFGENLLLRADRNGTFFGWNSP